MTPAEQQAYERGRRETLEEALNVVRRAAQVMSVQAFNEVVSDLKRLAKSTSAPKVESVNVALSGEAFGFQPSDIAPKTEAQIRAAARLALTAIEGRCYTHDGIDGLRPHTIDKGEGSGHRNIPCGLSANDLVALKALREALAASPAPKPCATCGGLGLLARYQQAPDPCPDCTKPETKR